MACRYLGVPFDGEGARINETVLESLQSDYAFQMLGAGTVMGWIKEMPCM